MSKVSILVVMVAGSLALGSYAYAWSPLAKDVNGEAPLPAENSVFEHFMQQEVKQPPVDESDESAPAPKLDASTSDTQSAEEAQSIIEKESSGPALEDQSAAQPESAAATEKTVERDDSEKSEPAVEQPKRKPKVAGKMPKESVTDPEFFLNRARAYVKDGDFQSALNYTDRALQLSPNWWAAWYEKGLIYQLAGYDAAAARRYLALLDRKPDMQEAHINLGALYRKHGNFSMAEMEYKKTIELNFHSFTAHYNLANLYMDQEKLEPALKEYKICLKLKPDNAWVHNNVGVIYQRRNYFEEAAREFKAASHLDPANQTFVSNLHHAHEKVGQKPVKGKPVPM